MAGNAQIPATVFAPRDPRQPVTPPLQPVSAPKLARGEGVRVRLTRIRGVTAPGVAEEPIWFPAGALNEFVVDEDSNISEYDTVGHGQFAAPAPGRPGRKRRLRVCDIETAAFFGDNAILTARGIDPQALRDELEAVIRSETAVRLLVTLRLPRERGRSIRPEVDMPATVRSIRRTLKHGEALTRYWTVRFVEDRDPTLGRRRYGGDPPGVQSNRGGSSVKHRLDGNDTLESLAKRYFKDKSAWRALANAIGMKSWGARTPLVQNARWKVDQPITIPDKLKRSGETYFMVKAGEFGG